MCWEAVPETNDPNHKLYLHKSYLGRYVHILCDIITYNVMLGFRGIARSKVWGGQQSEPVNGGWRWNLPVGSWDHWSGVKFRICINHSQQHLLAKWCGHVHSSPPGGDAPTWLAGAISIRVCI